MKNLISALSLAAVALSTLAAAPQQSLPKYGVPATPEPGTIVLMGVALVAGGGYTAWKRRNKK
jgi:hypothetical protein